MWFPKEIEQSMSTFIDVMFDYIYLPPELIGKIYTFVLEEYCKRIINKHCYNFIKMRKNIDCVIVYCINPFLHYNIIEDECIDSLKFLVNAHIPRKYDLNLWAAILRILSSEIARTRMAQTSNNKGFKSPEGKKLKLILDLWLQLCKKFNFKLFLKTNKFEKYIRATHIEKMNKYDQYLIPPLIIQPFTYMHIIDIDEARQTMEYYLFQ
tara:strand:- start:273 stop:899 length:627 start_codon:yes stop_codon:yes gene_type:complete